MKTATQEVGDMEIDLRETANRVSALKVELANLERRKVAIIEEGNGIKMTVEADAARRMAEARKEMVRVTEERAKLDADKKAFEIGAAAFEKEKVLSLRVQTEAGNVISNYKAMQDKLTRFIVMVKRESELI